MKEHRLEWVNITLIALLIIIVMLAAATPPLP